MQASQVQLSVRRVVLPGTDLVQRLKDVSEQARLPMVAVPWSLDRARKEAHVQAPGVSERVDERP